MTDESIRAAMADVTHELVSLIAIRRSIDPHVPRAHEIASEIGLLSNVVLALAASLKGAER